ncbi:MAG TPA: PAS domain S-box protein, partial [Armatimonadetes bacterium]|nr:PAS domain S-box protein [Armatimonadota bacterium]
LFTYRPSPELSEAIRQALSMPPTCESTAVVESVAVPGRDEIVSKIHKDVAQVAPEESMLNMSQEAIDALNASTSPSEYLVRICELCRRYVNVDKCAFLVRTELLGAPESVNGAAGTLIATLQVIGLAEGWIRRPTVTISMDALIEVAQHRKSVMITKGSHEYPYTRMREWLVGDVDAFIVAPVLLNGTAAGLFMALLEEASFGERERCALEVLLRQASVGIRYWQLQLQFERVSSYSHNLLESVNAGVIALDSQGYITTFNVAAERIFGLAAVQALGAHFKDALGGAFNPRLIGIIQRVLESGESIAGVQLEYLKSLGGTAIINLRAAPLRNEQGITIGAVMIVDDVTETMRRREALYRVLPRHVADRI